MFVTLPLVLLKFFGRAVFFSAISAVQLTSPGNWSTLGNKRSPHQTGTDNIPLRVPTDTLVEWSLGDSFPVPREIRVRLVYDSNHGPLDLQANALYNWTNAP